MVLPPSVRRGFLTTPVRKGRALTGPTRHLVSSPGREILQPHADGFDGAEVNRLAIDVVGALAVVPDVVAPAGGLGLGQREEAPTGEVDVDVAIGDCPISDGVGAFEAYGNQSAGTVAFDLDAEPLALLQVEQRAEGFFKADPCGITGHLARVGGQHQTSRLVSGGGRGEAEGHALGGLGFPRRGVCLAEIGQQRGVRGFDGGD